jgi:hypothetical protein
MSETCSPSGTNKLLSVLALCTFFVGWDSLVTVPLLPIMTGDTGIPADLGTLLDVCCVDWVRGRKGAIIVSPRKGAKDGPTQPYPTPRRVGRGPHRPLLPHRRRLRPP